jgi:putative ABC transport system permease protein
LTGNTMAQAVRERIPELAVLKTIGFSNVSILVLVLGEAVLLLFLGGATGMALASIVVDIVRQKLGNSIPLASLAGSTWLLGLAFTIAIGLIVGALPALRGMRLRIVEALAGR